MQAYGNRPKEQNKEPRNIYMDYMAEDLEYKKHLYKSIGKKKTAMIETFQPLSLQVK